MKCTCSAQWDKHVTVHGEDCPMRMVDDLRAAEEALDEADGAKRQAVAQAFCDVLTHVMNAMADQPDAERPGLWGVWTYANKRLRDLGVDTLPDALPANAVIVAVPREPLDAAAAAPDDEWQDAPVLGPRQRALVALAEAVLAQTKP